MGKLTLHNGNIEEISQLDNSSTVVVAEGVSILQPSAIELLQKQIDELKSTQVIKEPLEASLPDLSPDLKRVESLLSGMSMRVSELENKPLPDMDKKLNILTVSLYKDLEFLDQRMNELKNYFDGNKKILDQTLQELKAKIDGQDNKLLESLNLLKLELDNNKQARYMKYLPILYLILFIISFFK